MTKPYQKKTPELTEAEALDLVGAVVACQLRPPVGSPITLFCIVADMKLTHRQWRFRLLPLLGEGDFWVGITRVRYVPPEEIGGLPPQWVDHLKARITAITMPRLTPGPVPVTPR